VIVRVAGREFPDPRDAGSGAGGAGNAWGIDDAIAAAHRFETAGADAVHVTGWGRNSFSNFTDGPLPDAVGAYRDDARAVKDSIVRAPVIAVGRMLPEVAEEMVATGGCDFVAMGRQLLADPDLVAKLRAGRRASVRPCTTLRLRGAEHLRRFPALPVTRPGTRSWREADVASPRHVWWWEGGRRHGGRPRRRRAGPPDHAARGLRTAWAHGLVLAADHAANGPQIDWQAG